MIAGVGVDVVEIGRVGEAIRRHGEPFLRRILHAREDLERARTAEGVSYVAGLFAAKEAVMKALGTGMAGAAFRDIAVLKTASGQPRVELDGSAATTARGLGVGDWHVSITHSRTLAVAVAIATR